MILFPTNVKVVSEVFNVCKTENIATKSFVLICWNSACWGFGTMLKATVYNDFTCDILIWYIHFMQQMHNNPI